MSDNNVPSERGRPREPATDKAILDAALRLMGQRGYRGTSMEAVAAEAGVGKPTVYLRFPSKADLAIAAISELRLRDMPEPTGDLRADLVAQLRHLRRVVEKIVGMSLIGTLLAEEPEHPEFLARFREQVILARRSQLRGLLEAAAERGDVETTTGKIEVVIDMIVGSYYAHYLAGASFARSWADDVVDAALACVEQPTGENAPVPR